MPIEFMEVLWGCAEDVQLLSSSLVLNTLQNDVWGFRCLFHTGDAVSGSVAGSSYFSSNSLSSHSNNSWRAYSAGNNTLLIQGLKFSKRYRRFSGQDPVFGIKGYASEAGLRVASGRGKNTYGSIGRNSADYDVSGLNSNRYVHHNNGTPLSHVGQSSGIKLGERSLLLPNSHRHDDGSFASSAGYIGGSPLALASSVGHDKKNKQSNEWAAEDSDFLEEESIEPFRLHKYSMAMKSSNWCYNNEMGPEYQTENSIISKSLLDSSSTSYLDPKHSLSDNTDQTFSLHGTTQNYLIDNAAAPTTGRIVQEPSLGVKVEAAITNAMTWMSAK